MTRIVVVGGAGSFGARITERLTKITNVEVIIAGRNSDSLTKVSQKLNASLKVPIQTVVVDSCSVTPEQLADIGTDIVINASGPFQDQNTRLAEAAIANRSHYIDLADARPFVIDIEKLDQKARDAGVLIVSGASTVPGISSTVLCHLAQQLATMDSVAIGISPGNQFEPGSATTRSVLKGLGKPIETRRNGNSATLYGWQNLKRGNFAKLGKRWLCNVDVPDLELIPRHFPKIKTVSFQAGAELSIQHLGLWALSWAARARILAHPEGLTDFLLALKGLTKSFGSNTGGMFVTVTGRDHDGTRLEKRWTLVACEGHGPFIPTLASVILAKALARGEQPMTGARPCFDLVSYPALLEEISDLSITCTIDQAMR